MMTTNKNTSRTFLVVLFIGLLSAISCIALLYLDNKKLEDQVIKRDNLINKSVIEDSKLNTQKTKTDSIIERYIEDCNILINNKKVSTEELLDFMNNQINKIEDLKSQNIELSDSLNQYKSYVKLTKSNLNVDYKTVKKDNKYVSSIIIPDDSLKIYTKLYQLMKKDYGISYEIDTDEENIYYTKKYTKLDSALFVYKHYKHVLSGDTEGNITIILPDQEDVKNK